MKTFFKTTLTLALALCLCIAVSSGTALAHVVVRPAEVPTASFQTFTMSVPNEKDEPVTNIKLLIPGGLKHVTPTVKPDWHITTEKQNDDAVSAIIWSEDSIDAGFRDDFTFSAQVPAKPGDLQWKAYQTYQSGEIVAWDATAATQPKKADGSPDFSHFGPLSVTKVQDTVAASQNETQTTAADSGERLATTAIYVATAGIVLGLAGIFLATRRQK